MRRLYKDQRGLSLLELIIVIALTGLITAAITTTVFQVFNMNTRTANRMAAVSQVQQAGKLVSEDILEALSVNATEPLGFPLALTCVYYEINEQTGEPEAVPHQVTYSLDDGELWRSESVNGGQPTVTLVAEHINSDLTSFYPTGTLPVGDVLTFTVTATVGDETETREYKVQPRPGS